MPFDKETWPAEKLRATFISHFGDDKDRPHTFVKSSPVVPYNDPTLLFCNAGMNQFKPLFLGTADPSSPLYPLKRATNSQKCIRAGGKHNDLDDVGKDTYHHTFFEMLGNWSFGAYFKEEAIAMAFDLLVNVLGLPKEQLYASYFEGDTELGLEPDEEAKQIWLKYLPDTRVLPFDKADNFWEMGDTGPCGPCTEIHFDRIGGRDASALVNADDPMVIEIWNIVFIQFNREPSGEIRSLPNKHVDTGMGFERLLSIMQGKPSNYDTDAFSGIFEAIQTTTGCPPYQGRVGDDDVDGVDTAYRVVGDHIRTLSIAIADGATPSALGRGYVLRRILRRGVHYAHQNLGAQDGIITALIPALVQSLSGAYPELAAKQALLTEVIGNEEKVFAKTLQAGRKKFESVVAAATAAGSTVISGADAFFLYDTMGFPIDLTTIMAQEKNMTVDTASFEAKLEVAKEISRADRGARAGSGEGVRLVLEAEETSYLAKAGVQPTVDEAKYNWNENPKATVQALFVGRSGESSWVNSSADVPEGSSFGVVLDKTSFYAESGGQVADKGMLSSSSGPCFQVSDAQVAGGYVLHLGEVVAGAAPLVVGDAIEVQVDYDYRSQIAPNHTMTHVLNHALRGVLGDGVDQKGSIVDATKLRFDFSHGKALKDEQIAKVEEQCQAVVAQGLVVSTMVAPLSDSTEIETLRAVFGETYPDPVRVVSVGAPVEQLLEDPKNKKWKEFSVEFCGGTHLSNTSEAKAFVLLEETAVATGIRRIVGVTGDAAVAALENANSLKSQVDKAGSLPDAELGAEVTALTAAVNEGSVSVVKKRSLRNEIAALSKRLAEANKQKAKAAQKESSLAALAKVEASREAGESRCIVQVSLGGDSKALSKLVTEMSKKWPEGSVMALSVDEAKMAAKVASASTSIAANAWVSAAMAPVGGKGGGKPTSGSGSAKLASLDDAAKILEAAGTWPAEA